MRKILCILCFVIGNLCLAQARTENVDIASPRGTLKAVLQVPTLAEGQRVPMAIICHGFMSNKNSALIQRLADSLEAHGIASVRFDFNGHGESYGRQQEMTVPREIEDAKCVFDYVRRLPYVGTIAFVGHSQGGVVAAMTATQLGSEAVGVLCLLSPAAVLRDDALRGNLFGTHYDASRPPAEVTILGGAYTIGRDYVVTAQSLPIYETARQYDGPALVIHGKADDVVPYTYGKRFYDDLRHARLCLLDGEDHMYDGRESRPAHLVAEFLERELK